MVALARQHGDAVVAEAECLPFEADSFDVVTAVNAFQFVDDPINALAEFTRVLVPGGLIAIANWADAAKNDIDTIERALSDDDDESESKLRLPGGQQELLETFGLEVVATGLVEAPWHAADDDILVRGVLLGEDAEGQQRLADTVRAAAAPYRAATGGYVLRNAFRFAIGRVS
jgi:SAM-dependent methyltransferase